jgi:hypothetical protein
MWVGGGRDTADEALDDVGADSIGVRDEMDKGGVGLEANKVGFQLFLVTVGVDEVVTDPKAYAKVRTDAPLAVRIGVHALTNVIWQVRERQVNGVGDCLWVMKHGKRRISV